MSSSMYALHKQTHPPTGIEHSIYCNFYDSSEKNLVVAGSSLLRIFRLIPDTPPIGTKDETAADQACTNPKLKLECTQSFPLFGNVMCLQAVRLASSRRDALILSFMDAKFSLVEYDPGTHDLKTVSLHYFEEDYSMRGGHSQITQPPQVRVDPDGRCAAMLVFSRNIVILPFCKDTAIEDHQEGMATAQTTGSLKSSPVLATYTISLNDVDEKINNIIDLQFLYGYYEPTLLLLYEPVKTWPGRVAVRQDTCSIVALSLNIHQRVHPVIWSMSSLPFDCWQTLPVPKPIGGILVIATNSLLYLNQSVPPYGISLNSFTDFSTAFPLKPQEGIKQSLDCAQACFISYDKLVLSLKGGEIYVLTLFNDGMRSVRGFNFDRAAASVLTTCMTACEPGYLFLGSHLGNSLLLRYTEKLQEPSAENKLGGSQAAALAATEEDNQEDERPAKKKRQDNVGDWMAGDVALIEDADELEVYGSQAEMEKQLTSYIFEVCDSLLNIGPCARVCIGEPAFLSEEFSSNPDPDVELVATSGFGKNGALSVLQRSVRPQVVTTFELPGCVDMWTVYGSSRSKNVDVTGEPKDFAENETEPNEKPEQEEIVEGKKQDLSNAHAFLILSRVDNSMILQTGQEINELDHSGFSTQASTVFAGNVGNNRYVIQVSPMGVRLLAGVRQVQHIPLDVGSPIVWATVSDPYVLIMSEEGLIIQLTLRQDASGTSGRLAVSKPQFGTVKSRILTLCIYKDTSGLFTTATRIQSELDGSRQNKAADTSHLAGEGSGAGKGDAFDEDELLYGESGAAEKEEQPVVNLVNLNESLPKKVYELKEVSPTFWVFVSRENGILEIYSLPEYKLCYLVKNFPMGQKVLVDSVQMTSVIGSSSLMPEKQQLDKQQHEALPVVHEILVVGLGTRGTRPLLLSRIDEDLLIYEVFPYYETQTDNHLKLRFKKLTHNLILREHKVGKKDKGEAEREKTSDHLRWLRYFNDISGYSGIFICGARPHWIFLTVHGELRAHPMGIDGGITCFAPFHNVNCPKGFLYFNRQGDMRICVLPTHLTYDAPWPVRKVPLRSTPHYVSYHMETKTYCVATSTLEPCNRVVRFTGEEKEFEVLERDKRYIYPLLEKFSLQLFSPVSWDVIPNTKIDLEDWEHITCLKTLMLVSEGTESGLKGYVAIGTNYNYGEDVTSRGRIIILDIIDVVPEPGQPLTKNKMKVVYGKEQKGPVTALCQVVGLLLTAIGQKIYIWQLKDNDLVGIAFIDTQIYIHSTISVKNLILVADICKSISLLRYQEESRTLSLVSRDVRPMEVFAIEFFVDNSQVGFMVTDGEKNIILFMYQPEARESYGGQRLLKRGDFHLGSKINCLFRIQCRIGDFLHSDRRLMTSFEKRHVAVYATLDGSLGYIVPVPEKTYRRLLMLQNVMVTNIPHTAGLNPRAYRLYRSHRKNLMNPHKNILDGDLLWRYLNLSVMEKTEIARKIGTHADQIMDDFLEIDRLTAHF